MSLSQVLQVPFAPSRYGQPGGVLLPDLVNSQAQGSLGLIEDDDFLIQLFPRILPGSIGAATSTLQLSSGGSIVFTIKTVIGISGSTLLAEATDFTEYQDGNGNWYYAALLSLQATAVAAALGSSASVACIGEIRITDSTGAIMRYQFNITLYQAVYEGTESSPTAPTPGQVLQFTFGSQAIGSGVDHVTVTGLGLAQAPALFLPWIVKSGSSEANIDCVLRSGWTTDGFTVDLTGLTPDNTYVLNWIIIPTSGSVGSEPVGASVSSVTVDLNLPSAPTAIIPMLVKQSGDTNIRAYLRAGWTGESFTVDLSGATPDNTFVLYYLIIP